MLRRSEASTLIPLNFNKDLDTTVCKEMPQDARLETWKQNNELMPRFCRLVKPVSFTDGASSPVAYYSAIAFKEGARRGLSGISFAPMDVPDERAALLKQHTIHGFKCPLDQDVAVAIAIPWPDEINEWKTRHRPHQWPSSDLVTKVTK